MSLSDDQLQRCCEHLSTKLQYCRHIAVVDQLTNTSHFITEQEAQLSQKNRAMLRVIESFATSLRVTQGHS